MVAFEGAFKVFVIYEGSPVSVGNCQLVLNLETDREMIAIRGTVKRHPRRNSYAKTPRVEKVRPRTNVGNPELKQLRLLSQAQSHKHVPQPSVLKSHNTWWEL